MYEPGKIYMWEQKSTHARQKMTNLPAYRWHLRTGVATTCGKKIRPVNLTPDNRVTLGKACKPTQDYIRYSDATPVDTENLDLSTPVGKALHQLSLKTILKSDVNNYGHPR